MVQITLFFILYLVAAVYFILIYDQVSATAMLPIFDVPPFETKFNLRKGLAYSKDANVIYFRLIANVSVFLATDFIWMGRTMFCKLKVGFTGPYP